MASTWGTRVKYFPRTIECGFLAEWRLVYLCRVELKVCVQINHSSMEHQKKKPQEKKKTCINVLNGTNDLGGRRGGFKLAIVLAVALSQSYRKGPEHYLTETEL